MLIIYFRGIAELLEILSPFNIVNVIVTVATLAPGLVLVHFGAKTPEEEARELADNITRRSRAFDPHHRQE